MSANIDWIFIIGVVIGLALGTFITRGISVIIFEDDAVEHGHAAFVIQGHGRGMRAEWAWKTNCVEKP